MQTVKPRQLAPKTLLIRLLPLLVLAGGEAWAGSLGARPGVGTSAGFGGGIVGVGPGLPGPAGVPVAAPRTYVAPVGVPGPRGVADPRGVYDPRGVADPRGVYDPRGVADPRGPYDPR